MCSPDILDLIMMENSAKGNKKEGFPGLFLFNQIWLINFFLLITHKNCAGKNISAHFEIKIELNISTF